MDRYRKQGSKDRQEGIFRSELNRRGRQLEMMGQFVVDLFRIATGDLVAVKMGMKTVRLKDLDPNEREYYEELRRLTDNPMMGTEQAAQRTMALNHGRIVKERKRRLR